MATCTLMMASQKNESGENIMTIEKGMIFMGNVNGVCFKILSATEKVVTYQTLGEQSGKIYHYGRQAFEHCNLIKI